MLVIFANHSSAMTNLGGAERSLLRLVEDWYAADPGFEAFFFTKNPRGLFVAELERRGWAYDAIRFRGWVTPRLPDEQRIAFARTDYAAVQRMMRIIASKKPDLVVTNTLVSPWAAFAAKALDVPHAWMVREFWDFDDEPGSSRRHDETLSDIGLLSEHVIANSRWMRDHLSRFMPEGRVSIAYPSIDAGVVDAGAREPASPAPFDGPDEGLRITSVGRLSPSKGQTELIEAIATLARDGVIVRLCLVGGAAETGYDDELRRRAESAGIGDRVTVVGEKQNPYPFVAAAQLVVNPSPMEGFGRTSAEAMLLGRPVIASIVGGGGELVENDVTGLHFDPENRDGLTAAIRRYATTPGLAERHGAAGRERAQRLLAEHDSVEAIENLRTASRASGYRLPFYAREWFWLAATLPAPAPAAPRPLWRRVASTLRRRAAALRPGTRR